MKRKRIGKKKLSQGSSLIGMDRIEKNVIVSFI